ncbi:MAG TPA: hypothetical protein VGZ52_09060 [Acidimicrobiales bacterium]|nr:hypothetical protein [Acidimicrobiales bacterium]
MNPHREGVAFYLDVDGRAVHAVLHEATGHARETAVLIVAPFGWEDVSSYRSRRSMAIDLADHGYATLRFDLPGTGDSDGTADDPELVAEWIRTISVAAAELRSVSACTTVAAMGFDIGGLLACAASAAGAAIEELVLWAVPGRGRAIVRELNAFAQLLASRGADEPALPDGTLSVNGYVMTPATAASVNALDVRTNARPHVRRALVLGRDDLPADDAVRAALHDGGAVVDVRAGPGYGELMAPPQESAPPAPLMAAVRDWLGARTVSQVVAHPSLTTAATVHAADGTDVRERVLTLAVPGAELSAVLAEPVGASQPLCAVLLNAGAVRRTGPSRVWVDTARRWAAAGVPTVRVDLAGIGDSTGSVAYPLADLELYEGDFGAQVTGVLDDLVALALPSRFVLGGLCSGAYWSFEIGQSDPRVGAVVMLNPKALVMDPFVEAVRTMRLMRNRSQPRFWRRLVRGDVPVAGIKSGAAFAARAALAAPEHLRAARRARSLGIDELDRGFDRLAQNGVDAVLVFSAQESLRLELDADGRLQELGRRPNLDLQLLEGSVETHTLQPPHVQQQVGSILDAALARFLSEPRSGARPP